MVSLGLILISGSNNIFHVPTSAPQPDHSDSERGNLLLPHGLLFLISSKGSFICIIPDRITHTTAFVTPIMEHWLECNKKERKTFYLMMHSTRTVIWC